MSCIKVVHPVKVLLGVGSLRVQGNHVLYIVHKGVSIELLDVLPVGLQPVQHELGALPAATDSQVHVSLVLSPNAKEYTFSVIQLLPNLENDKPRKLETKDKYSFIIMM